MGAGASFGASDEDRHSLQRINVILIGDTAVGKSSIVNRIVNGTFDPTMRASTTFGVFLYESQDPDDPELEIWDTSGREQYREINRQYYHNAAAALLVFDLTSRVTFQNALNVWKADFEAMAIGRVFLIGNKCDCQDGIAVSEEARNWAKENSVQYFPISARTGEGIDDMLNGLLKMFSKGSHETDTTSNVKPLTAEQTSNEADSASSPVSLSDLVLDITGYKKGECIGSGSFGSVFVYEKEESRIAVKHIPGTSEINQTVFEREVSNLQSLSHPFIVHLRGFALPSPANDNHFMIAMEYVSGGSLLDAVKTSPPWFDDSAKAIITYGIAIGMTFIHSKGIIHRDLKPGNILLDEQHLPRICDFGSSRIYSLDSTLTNSPSFTTVYGAPELYEGNYGEKVDVYSFGMILYEIVTGQLALRGLSMFQLMKHISLGKRANIPGDVSPAARDLIEQCWSQDPSYRPSFREICAILKSKLHLIFPKIDFYTLAKFVVQHDAE